MPEPVCVAGIVLAGGKSRRMGRAKASLLAPDGRTFLRVALDALIEAGASPLFVGGGQGLAAEAEAGGATFVADLRPDQGPLAGLEATFSAARSEWVLVVACDMPRLDPALLKALLEWATGSEKEAVVPLVKDRLQPLHALYRRAPCLLKISAALDAGRLAVTALAKELDAERPILPTNASFLNVNTLEELDALGG